MLRKIARFTRNPAYYIHRAARSGMLAAAANLNDEVFQAIESDMADENLPQVVRMVNREPNKYTRFLDTEFHAKYAHNRCYHILLATAEYARGNVEIALGHMERAQTMQSTPFVWHCIARLYNAMDDDVRAVEALDRGLAEFPGDELLRAEKAGAVFRLGDTAKANALIAGLEHRFADQQEQSQGLKAELEKAIAENLTDRQSDGDIYDDAFVTKLWWAYNYDFRCFTRFQEGSGLIQHLIQKHIGGLLENEAAACRTVVDFGVMCAAPNYSLARRFPQMQHYGVDRQPLIKQLNDAMYRADNFTFHDGSILDFIVQKKAALKDSLMFHVRTSPLCYPAFLRQYYKACYDAGVKHIAMIEFGGLSKTTLKFHDFNHPTEDSVPMRGIMFIHNHKRLLEDAGYEVVAEKRYLRPGLAQDMGLCEANIYMHAVRRD